MRRPNESRPGPNVALNTTVAEALENIGPADLTGANVR